jgi:molybdopterin-guanine dinucleotide biosynthesis protein A
VAASIGEPAVVNVLDVTGLVLAGGMGRRMGGVDKGLVPLDGRAMIAHVIERLSRQVGAILINANQNVERYAEFGYPVVSDGIGGFAGPLAASMPVCPRPCRPMSRRRRATRRSFRSTS